MALLEVPSGPVLSDQSLEFYCGTLAEDSCLAAEARREEIGKTITDVSNRYPAALSALEQEASEENLQQARELALSTYRAVHMACEGTVDNRTLARALDLLISKVEQNGKWTSLRLLGVPLSLAQELYQAVLTREDDLNPFHEGAIRAQHGATLIWMGKADAGLSELTEGVDLLSEPQVAPRWGFYYQRLRYRALRQQGDLDAASQAAMDLRDQIRDYLKLNQSASDTKIAGEDALVFKATVAREAIVLRLLKSVSENNRLDLKLNHGANFTDYGRLISKFNEVNNENDLPFFLKGYSLFEQGAVILMHGRPQDSALVAKVAQLALKTETVDPFNQALCHLLLAGSNLNSQDRGQLVKEHLAIAEGFLQASERVDADVNKFLAWVKSKVPSST